MTTSTTRPVYPVGNEGRDSLFELALLDPKQIRDHAQPSGADRSSDIRGSHPAGESSRADRIVQSTWPQKLGS